MESADVEQAAAQLHRAGRTSIATYLKAVQRSLGRAQTIANALGQHNLARELEAARGHVGRIQRDHDCDREWAVQDSALRQLEETMASAARYIDQTRSAAREAAIKAAA